MSLLDLLSQDELMNICMFSDTILPQLSLAALVDVFNDRSNCMDWSSLLQWFRDISLLDYRVRDVIINSGCNENIVLDSSVNPRIIKALLRKQGYSNLYSNISRDNSIILIPQRYSKFIVDTTPSGDGTNNILARSQDYVILLCDNKIMSSFRLGVDINCRSPVLESYLSRGSSTPLNRSNVTMEGFFQYVINNRLTIHLYEIYNDYMNRINALKHISALNDTDNSVLFFKRQYINIVSIRQYTDNDQIAVDISMTSSRSIKLIASHLEKLSFKMNVRKRCTGIDVIYSQRDDLCCKFWNNVVTMVLMKRLMA
uniref:Uncharacterized protein n=1 Tax=viral metagenome TaxID=1070528 RepID=A0A6C0BLI8_9ZZZZ